MQIMQARSLSGVRTFSRASVIGRHIVELDTELGQFVLIVAQRFQIGLCEGRNRRMIRQ